MPGSDAFDQEKVCLEPEELEGLDPLYPDACFEGDNEWSRDDDYVSADVTEGEGDEDLPFPEFIADKIVQQFGPSSIPHPSDVSNASFRLPGRGGEAVRQIAMALAAQKALQSRLAGDAYSLRMLEDLSEGLGMAVLALWAELRSLDMRHQVNQDMMKRATRTLRATEARRARGEPKRQWAVNQKSVHPEWSWTTHCQQVEAEFGMSEGAGRRVLSSIRHLLDPKQGGKDREGADEQKS